MKDRSPKKRALERLLVEIRSCTACESELPLGARPVLNAGHEARILVVGQAPGRRVHETGIPWNDASGDRLRAWLGVDRDTFYDPARFALVPMGFCYPGRKGGGDAPPRPECAPLWHGKLLEHLPRVELILLAGLYAQKRYLGPRAEATLTENVRRTGTFGRLIPLPHPSPRNNLWLRKNPWFESRVLPHLRRKVAQILAGQKERARTV